LSSAFILLLIPRKLLNLNEVLQDKKDKIIERRNSIFNTPAEIGGTKD
jgi:hypothetical protein